jgi:hypothetical protein
MLLRGTPLYEDRAKLGLTESVGDRIPLVVSSPTFTVEDHARMAQIAEGLLANDSLPAGPPLG